MIGWSSSTKILLATPLPIMIVMKQIISKILLFIGLILMTSCPPMSRIYKTLEWEAPLFQNSTRCVFPEDIRTDVEKHLKSQKLINWVGIITEIDTKLNADTGIIEITFEQKYWNYIEDFTTRKKMFISPHGEGEFYYIARHFQATQGILDTLTMNIQVNDLGICYGYLLGLRNNNPVLAANGIRFVPYKYYSTNIMSYKAKKDSLTGETICIGNMYETTDFKLLKIAGPEQNK